MNEDRVPGHENPASRREIIRAADNLYCSICDAFPCYLLSTAAMSVLHEQLTENDVEKPTNLISAVQYAQSLERLQSCLNRHIEVTREAWQLDEHFRVSEEVINELQRQGHDVKRWQAILHLRTKDPPSLN
jgi:uncharacterized protein (UPF0335 family)